MTAEFENPRLAFSNESQQRLSKIMAMELKIPEAGHMHDIKAVASKLTWDISSNIKMLRSFLRLDVTEFEKYIDINSGASCDADQFALLKKLFQELDFEQSSAPKVFRENSSKQVLDVISEIDIFLTYTSSANSSDEIETIGDIIINDSNS